MMLHVEPSQTPTQCRHRQRARKPRKSGHLWACSPAIKRVEHFNGAIICQENGRLIRPVRHPCGQGDSAPELHFETRHGGLPSAVLNDDIAVARGIVMMLPRRGGVMIVLPERWRFHLVPKRVVDGAVHIFAQGGLYHKHRTMRPTKGCRTTSRDFQAG